MDILKELPTDVQRIVLDKYIDRTTTGKRYVVECYIGINGHVNWQGASAWNNGDSGDDEFYYMIHPIFQIIYNQDTDTWHRPGNILEASLPVEGDFIKQYKTIPVGQDILHKKTVQTMMRRKINCKAFYKKMEYLEKHNQEGCRRDDEKYESHAYTVSWNNQQEVVLRVREIVDTPPTNKKDVWERRDPSQYMYECLFHCKYNPYDFHTKHTYYRVLYPEDATYVWKCVRNCLETKGDFSTLDVEYKEPDFSECIL